MWEEHLSSGRKGSKMKTLAFLCLNSLFSIRQINLRQSRAHPLALLLLKHSAMKLKQRQDGLQT